MRQSKPFVCTIENCVRLLEAWQPNVSSKVNVLDQAVCVVFLGNSQVSLFSHNLHPELC